MSIQEKLPNVSLSHIELYVNNVEVIKNFFTRALGFVVTDEEQNGMVFLSRHPDEHHQIVLNPRPSHQTVNSPVDHIAFRVNSVTELRQFHQSLQKNDVAELKGVSHGTAWSLYFRDPEGNRFEVFTDTPWYVHQPCRFEVDFDLSDEELVDFTHNKIKDMPGFAPVEQWSAEHHQAVAQA